MMMKSIAFRVLPAGPVLLAGVLMLSAAPAVVFAQIPNPVTPPASSGTYAASGVEEPKSADQRINQLEREVAELKNLVHQLQGGESKAVPVVSSSSVPAPSAQAPVAGAAPVSSPAESPKVVADLLHGMTINAMLDTYYERNSNSPIGRINTLRAYDISSNSFSLNQADLVLESAPDAATGKRAGMRLDLQWGQATSTLQGNPANELRPEVYRNIFQAYGTYVFPVGEGLTVDFGKWASSLGIEGNYTKDQLNYSRSWWFDFLPFYHTGVRAKYALSDKAAVNLWITNEAQQTEAFNNYKDQLLGLVLTPTPEVSWTLNYYRGQEHPDVVYLTNPSPEQQNLPNQQGTFILPIANPPDGLLQIADSYITWQPSPAFTLAVEADYVQQRLYSYSAPQRVYAGYQFSPKFAVAARAEFLADRGGLFSGTAQNLTEETLTFDYRPEDRFLLRTEFRRDHSNKPFFLGDTLGILKTSQPTLGIGLVWWFGQKEGTW
jgi:hypothetical protein